MWHVASPSVSADPGSEPELEIRWAPVKTVEKL